MRVVQATLGTFHHFDLARELEARGYLTRIHSTFPWSRLQREGVSRERVRTFPWLHVPQLALGRAFRMPRFLNNALGYANALSYDYWLTKVLPPCDVYVALSGCAVWSGKQAQRLGAKYVCDRGSSHMRYQDRILTEEYRRWGAEMPPLERNRIERAETEYETADVITVPSEFALRSFLEMGVPASKMRKVPYGVRLDRFQRVGEPPKDSFEVLFTGSVSLRKGIPYLIEAFRQLKHPRKRLRIVGPVLPEVQAYFVTQDLTDIEILGRLPQAEIPRMMSTSHVMVLPSIEEGLALVQGQALACGCPLISSFHTGGEDLFTDGMEGFLVPVRSVRAIAERLQQLADDPMLQQRMSEAALQRVKLLGGWQHYGEAYSQMLKDLCSFN